MTRLVRVCESEADCLPVNGPGQLNLNIAMTKINRVAEGKDIEFRAELFNFLNQLNFGTPNNNVFHDAAGTLDPNVGRITTTSTSMRQVQLGLKFIF